MFAYIYLYVKYFKAECLYIEGFHLEKNSSNQHYENNSDICKKKERYKLDLFKFNISFRLPTHSWDVLMTAKRMTTFCIINTSHAFVFYVNFSMFYPILYFVGSFYFLWYTWVGNFKKLHIAFSIFHKRSYMKFPALDKISTFDMKTFCESVRKRLRKPHNWKFMQALPPFRSLRFISMSVVIFLCMLFQSTSILATKIE